ncbi:MAG TPA: choice-of-anchor Q domain-containing protein [Vicinamibacterales bacterium]|nr:choice-of-anchor Q domain-containing protein [Vicinamibacterales bacterium]
MNVLAAALLLLLSVAPAAAAEWFVAPAGAGPGTKAAPFGRIQDAIDVAGPGDTISVLAGTYAERLRTVRHGKAGATIRLRAEGPRGSVLVTMSGRVLTVSHAYFTVEGLVFDGQYGADDTVRVATAASYFTLRDSEVRRSTHDLIDLGGPAGVLIEHCLIHHALNARDGRTDAHGIAAGAVRKLTIRHTEIHTFSGDGFQVDPGRSAPGWSDVVIDSVRFWLAPLPRPENGFAAGVVPGENAIDTKASARLPRARLTVRNTTASGFRNGLISNMSAFNLKEHIDATLDGVTVFDSEIAFRLRGEGSAATGAWVTLQNAVVHTVATAYRYEEDIAQLRIWNNTLGTGVTRAFQAAQSSQNGLDVRNVLVLGPRPAEAADASNLSVDARAFVDAARHDYRLAPAAPAIDTGVTLPGVSADRDGVKRPVGSKYDVGAYEWQPPILARKPAHRVRVWSR